MLRDADASAACCRRSSSASSETAQRPSIEAPDAHEISLALIPGRPSFPRTGPWTAAAVALGIVLGLLLVYVRELTDSTFHSGDDVRLVSWSAVPGVDPAHLAPRTQGRQRRRPCRTQATLGAGRATARIARRTHYGRTGHASSR